MTRGANRTPGLRFVTYLAPSIPRRFFGLVVAGVERHLGIPCALRVETGASGPVPGAADPFATGEVDVGFVCSPSLFGLGESGPAAIGLLGVAPVFADPRVSGRPLYFSEVIVRRASPARELHDLAGGSWSYNDTCSLSGYYNLLRRLAALGADRGFFRELRPSGSHVRSIRLVASGAVDAAAIDSNVLRLQLRRHPDLGTRIRVLESWGPFPIQPVVARRGLDPGLRERVAAALLALGNDRAAARPLAAFGFERFVSTGEAAYEAERAELERCELV